MLDFVGGGRSCEAKMLFPTLRRIGEVGINISAVEDISCSTGIENSIRRHSKSRKHLDGARLIVPDQSTLAERYTANPAASTLEIIDHHRWGLIPICWHKRSATIATSVKQGAHECLISVLRRQAK